MQTASPGKTDGGGKFDERELAAKLDQFPANAEFRFVSPQSEEAAPLRARVEAAILASGRRIAP